MINPKIKSVIKGFEKDLIALRQDFHKHPEIGMKEVRTSKILKDLLKKYGYSISKENFANTGFVATLKNGSSKKIIGLRAEMDALPILEAQNKLPYRSVNEGFMHACGHDGHMVMVLGAARYLAQTKNWNGTLRIIYQPNEEGSGFVSGGALMVKEGVFKKYPVDQIFAIHNMPVTNLQPGAKPGNLYFYMGKDATMAGIDGYFVKLIGKGGHGSTPEYAKDVITCAADIVMALQSIISRNIAASDRAVLNVGAINSGQAANVIPETADLAISTRSVTREVREKLRQRITTVINSIASAYDIKAEIKTGGTPPTINDPKSLVYARKIAEDVLGKNMVGDGPQLMGSEDFAAMLDVLPGCYGFIANPNKALPHNPNFMFDDSLILTGSTYFSGLVEDYLSVDKK